MKTKLLFAILPLVSFFNVSSVSAQLSATITSQTYPLCNGGVGTATVTDTGGTTPYTYTWAPAGGTNATATGLTAGTYTVFVVDAASNSASATVTISQPTPVIIMSSSSNDVSCFGDMNGYLVISALGGTPPYSYSWAPSGDSTTIASGLSAGIYTVTVTDNNACSGTATFTVTQPTPITAIGSSTPNTTCVTPNGTAIITATGGTPNYKYTWTPTGQTNATATGLNAGTYVCTIVDSHDCTDSVTVVVTGTTGPTLTVYSTPDTSGCNGSAMAIASGGVPPYTFLWSPSGNTNAHVMGLCAGSYCCIVTDLNGCSASSCVTVVNTCTFSVSVADSGVTCVRPGIAWVSPLGGTPPFTYLWSPGGETTANITGLIAGVYSVNVQDSNGCIGSGSISVTSQTVSYYINGNPLYINPGDSILLTASCSIPATFAWSPPATITSPSSSSTYAHPAGTTTYSVSITTSCGTHIDSVTINAQCFLLTMSSTPSHYCTSSYDGTATVTPSGGTAPYTYSWSSGSISATATGIPPGSYSVIVHDHTGCSAMGSVNVDTSLANLTVSAMPPNIALGDSSYLSASVPVTATYSWSPATGLSCSICDNPIATPTVTTTYTIIATTSCRTIRDTVTVYVDTFTNSYNEPICIATIDTATNKVEIIWGRTNSPPQSGYGSYVVYKENAASVFVPIDNQPLNVLSDYVDTSYSPPGPISYKLATDDSCGESALSTTHTTIYLTTTSAPNVYILNWTAYVGFTPARYRIFRGLTMGSMTQIDSVPNTTLTYHDTLPPSGSIYIVEAVSPSGVCIPTASILRHRIATAVLSGSYSNGYYSGPLITTSIQQLPNNILQLNIYPNPSNGMMNVSYSINGNGAVQITILNELGQALYNNTEQKTTGDYTEQLNLESLASGIYTLRMQTAGGTSVKKVVVMKK